MYIRWNNRTSFIKNRTLDRLFYFPSPLTFSVTSILSFSTLSLSYTYIYTYERTHIFLHSHIFHQSGIYSIKLN